MIRPDGSFMLSGLAPGTYTLRAFVPPPGPGLPQETLAATVTVSGEDVTGVVLETLRPGTVAGRIVADAATAEAALGAGVRVDLLPADTSIPFMAGGPAVATVKDDLSFEVSGPPGKLRVAVMVQRPDVMLKAVRVNGADVTDAGFALSTGARLEGVEIELTNRPPDVSGSVTGARGERLSDYTVVFFPQDRERRANVMRGLALGRPDQEGRFRVRMLPPGSYYAVALEYVDANGWRDPDFLESLSAEATAFTIAEGETRTLDLKMTAPR